MVRNVQAGVVARSAVVAQFEDFMDSAFSRYSRLPAIPDRAGSLRWMEGLPVKKRAPRLFVHLPPLDPIRFPTLHNPTPNGLALDPTDDLRRKPAAPAVEEEDEAEMTVSERLAAALRANSARVLDLFRLWDENDDGEVSKAEFVRAFQEENGLMKGLDVFEKEARGLFDEWDADGSGSISFTELKKLLSKRPAAASALRMRRGMPEPRMCYPVNDAAGPEGAPLTVQLHQVDRRGGRSFPAAPAPPRRIGGV